MSDQSSARILEDSDASGSASTNQDQSVEAAESAGPSIIDNLPVRAPSRQSIREDSLRRLERRHSGERRQDKEASRQSPLPRCHDSMVDLRLLDYANAYDENLMCPICHSPFIDPVMLIDCDHYFCRECIQQCWKSRDTWAAHAHEGRGECPTCRRPAKLGPPTATSKILLNMVGGLLVRCPNREAGCSAQVKRGDVQDHIDIYCRYTMVECSANDCSETVRRKDENRGCLHYPASCLDCRAEMQQWLLETHWLKECEGRNLACNKCETTVSSRRLEEHKRTECPERIVACTGDIVGCTYQSKPAGISAHEESCVLARLAPMWTRQQARLDEQESAQRRLNRKLAVLEDGFANVRNLLQPFQAPAVRYSSSDAAHANGSYPAQSFANDQIGAMPPLHTSNASDSSNHDRTTTTHETGAIADDQALPYELLAPMSGSTNTPDNGPYASPLHHVLSLHEALRDEVSRVAATLSQLEGRHSMQILNENLRTREDLSYLGAQVGALQRHVHWLTSTQLQRQQHQQGGATSGGGRVGGGGGGGVGSSAAAEAGAGGMEGVVGAVNSAATALRGAARIVGVGSSFQSGQANGSNAGDMAMGSGRETVIRRRASEEGRTKL